MAGRSQATHKKRQREIARVEKQRDKAAKRLEKKDAPRISGDDAIDYTPIDYGEYEPREDSAS